MIKEVKPTKDLIFPFRDGGFLMENDVSVGHLIASSSKEVTEGLQNGGAFIQPVHEALGSPIPSAESLQSP